MQEYFIETQEALTDVCQQLSGSAWLALDTEFIREKTYYPKLCLIQICDGIISACIDPLVLDDLSPLAELLYEEDGTKVFHAAGQDLEIFLMTWGQLPNHLFDTQLAATLLGLGEQVGYANLVQKMLGVHLPKTQSRTDWSHRPLDKEQLRYAHDDVIYLGDVYLKIQQQLQQQGRSDWLKEDFFQLGQEVNYQPNYSKIWMKVKGKQHLKGKEVLILNALATWRENKAIAYNRPKRWILKDEILIDLAKRQPEKQPQLYKIRGFDGHSIKQYGDELLALIKKTAQLPKKDWPAIEKIPEKPTPEEDERIDLLMCGLRVIANQHGITPSVIAHRKEVEKLVRGQTDNKLLSGWRKSLAGHRLVDLLEGKLCLKVIDNKTCFIESITVSNKP